MDVAGALRDEDGLVFLDSSLASHRAISLIGCHPDRIVEGGADDWRELKGVLAGMRCDAGDTGLPHGAAIGWVAFDGSFRFGIYRNLLAYRHGSGEWFAYGDPVVPMESGVGEEPGVGELGAGWKPEFVADLAAADFCTRVERVRSYIAAGDIYQACLTHRFRAAWDRSISWPFYESLRHFSPAPHAGYLDLAGTTVMSASPETFLRMSGSRIATRPIKGTRPRFSDRDQDERSAYELITSAKEISELVMITDLERNDLGKVCEFGSVEVSELLALERFEQVFHLVSTVEGNLRAEVSHVDALRACFPGGSISGAPKQRALEIIDELEPVPRGIYTGAVGYFGFNGESQFNIAIRTVIAAGAAAEFHVGAGIVADSDPQKEWQETLDKARGILTAAANVAVGAATRSR